MKKKDYKTPHMMIIEVGSGNLMVNSLLNDEDTQTMQLDKDYVLEGDDIEII